jgi:hypothetical protein
VAPKQSPDLGALARSWVGGAVVEHGVGRPAGRRRRRPDRVQGAQELLSAGGAACTGPARRVRRGAARVRWRRGARAVDRGAGPPLPGRHPGPVRPGAWVRGSRRRRARPRAPRGATPAGRRRARRRRAQLGREPRVPTGLEGPGPCGLGRCARQTRRIGLAPTPTAPAMAAAVRRVAPRGGSPVVGSTDARSVAARGEGGTRAGRASSRGSPAAHALAREALPPARRTRGPDLPVRRLTSCRCRARGRDDPRPPDVLSAGCSGPPPPPPPGGPGRRRSPRR